MTAWIEAKISNRFKLQIVLLHGGMCNAYIGP
jgi:hypothetical protein